MKTAKPDPLGIYAATTAALEPYRASIEAKYTASMEEDVERFRHKLAAEGWDIEKAYPYPSTGMTRFMYQVTLEDYHAARLYVNHKKASRGHREPDPVTMKPAAQIAKIISTAAKAAAASLLASYIAKLAKKQTDIMKTNGDTNQITLAVYVGHLWEESTLTYDGHGLPAPYRWRTHCIINRSSLGKTFEQFPTRQISV